MDRKTFKSKPFHVINDSRTGDIKRIVTPGAFEVGTPELPEDIKVYGVAYLTALFDINGNPIFETNEAGDVIVSLNVSGSAGSQSEAQPDAFSNLMMWLESSGSNVVALDTTAPTSVQNWYDLSGNGRHLSQGTKARQPRWYAQNPLLSGSLPSLEFQSAQVMSSSAINISSYTIIVGMNNKAATTLVFEHGPDLNTNDGCWLHTSNAGAGATIAVKRAATMSSKDMPVAAWATQTDQTQIFTVHHSGTHASLRLLINNWDPQTLLSTNQSANLGQTAVNTPMYVGGRSAFAAMVSGSMFAFIVYSPAIPLYQSQKVVRYLGNKYGVPVL